MGKSELKPEIKEINLCEALATWIRGGGRLKIRASEINRKVATFKGSLLSEDGYFGTGYGITQVVKESVNISQNTIQDYTQPEDQFPVSPGGAL